MKGYKMEELQTFLMQEDTEKFYCQATDLDEAREFAQMWNAVVLGRVPDHYRTLNINPNNGNTIPLMRES